MHSKPIRIGVIGTGYVSRHFYLSCQKRPDLEITKVLTRRHPKECHDFPEANKLTQSLSELIDHCDVVYECSGDPIHAADSIQQAFLAEKPVVTTNSEFHVTCGSFFENKGLLTEAEGDQPGALAALHQRALDMGFKPLAYLNIKGFLNYNPSPQDMKYWSHKNGISLASVTAFTDGTKIQFEQALVANGLQGQFAKEGMIGLEESNLDKIKTFYGDKAQNLRAPLSDYILYAGAPHGVLLIAEHESHHQAMLRYVKLGDGPYYILRQDAILIDLEVPRSIHRLLQEKKPLLTNSANPQINVVSVAKRPLKKGEWIKQGIGGFETRGLGVPIRQYPNALPIGLLQNARVTQTVEPGQILTFDDVDLPESLALKAWCDTCNAIVNNGETVSL